MRPKFRKNAFLFALISSLVILSASSVLAGPKLTLPKVAQQDTPWGCGPNVLARLLGHFGQKEIESKGESIPLTYKNMEKVARESKLLTLDIGDGYLDSFGMTANSIGPFPANLEALANRVSTVGKFKLLSGQTMDSLYELLDRETTVPVIVMRKGGDLDLGFLGKFPLVHYIVITGYRFPRENEDADGVIFHFADTGGTNSEISYSELKRTWIFEEQCFGAIACGGMMIVPVSALPGGAKDADSKTVSQPAGSTAGNAMTATRSTESKTNEAAATTSSTTTTIPTTTSSQTDGEQMPVNLDVD